MAKPYVKDGAITYDEFEQIYSILSKKEQYKVTDILYENGINLIDEHIADTDIILDIDNDEVDVECDDFEVLYDENIFKDSKADLYTNESLVIHKEVRQSNEILCALIQQGNLQAAQDLCVKNKKLVEKYAAAYDKHFQNRLDFEDLVQVGFLGLMKAANMFDVKLGSSFSTYAVYWIKQSISREIMDNGYAIRIPVHMMERVGKVTAIYNRLAGEGLSLQKAIVQIADELGLSEEMVRESMILKENVIGYTSLDTPIGEDGDTVLGDFIPAEDEESVEQIVTRGLLRQQLEGVLQTLTPREEHVIRMRFGLVDGRPRTLEEVGKEFNITRERIRQIEAKAMRKLRHSSRSRRLKDYMGE